MEIINNVKFVSPIAYKKSLVYTAYVKCPVCYLENKIIDITGILKPCSNLIECPKCGQLYRVVRKENLENG